MAATVDAARAEDEYADLYPVGADMPLLRYVQAVWRRREFAHAIATGEVRSQHADTVLGNLWQIINPLLLVGIYYFIFGVVIGTDRGLDNFLGFLAVGVFMYQYSQKSITGGAKSITANEGLLRSIQFPRAILPAATVLGHTLAFVPAIGVMLVVALATGEMPALAWLLLAPLFVVQMLFNIGFAFITARANDRFRDLQHVLPYIFRILFYMSGIIFSVERFVQDPVMLGLFDLNPFYAFPTVARGFVLDGMVATRPLISALVWTVGALVFGFLYFRRGEHEYGRG